MGGVNDFLFGGSDDPSVSQATTLTDDQKKLLDQLTGLMGGQLGTGVSPYPGTMTSGPSGLETQSWDMISKLMSGASNGSLGGASQDAISKVMGGTTNLPSAVNVKDFNVPGPVNVSDMNVPGKTDVSRFTPQGFDVGEFDPGYIQDWYQKSMVAPALQQWESDIVPQVKEHYIGQNAGSSQAANRAIAGSAEDLMTGLNSNLADVMFGEKQAYDTRKYDSGMDLVNKLFEEQSTARGLDVQTGENMADRLQQAGLTKQGLDFQSGSNYANNLLNSLLQKQWLQYDADTNAANQKYQAGQADLDRMMNVPGIEGQFINNLLGISSAGAGAGATQRGIDQSKLNEEYQKWSSSQGYNNPWLNLMPTALGTSAFENIVDPGSQQSGIFQSLIMPLLSAKMSSGSSWSDLFSWGG